MDVRILVVGAGISGLAVARTLTRAGFSAEVVERQPVWGEAGTGIYLPGNAARALGLEQAVAERGAVIPRQCVSDERGPLLVEVDLGELWDGVGPCLALCGTDLHTVLLEGLSAFEARRRPRTDWVRVQTHRRDRTRYLPTAIRNAALGAFSRSIFRSNYRPLLEEA